jgi:hypothetical protein
MKKGKSWQGCGKVIQKIRVEHPRLVNHEFFKYFGRIFDVNKNSQKEKLIISNRI